MVVLAFFFFFFKEDIRRGVEILQTTVNQQQCAQFTSYVGGS